MLGLISSAVKVSDADEAVHLPKCRRGRENLVAHFDDSTLHHGGREMNETKTFYAAQKKRMERREPCRGSVDSTSARQTDSQRASASVPFSEMK